MDFAIFELNAMSNRQTHIVKNQINCMNAFLDYPGQCQRFNIES